MKIITECEFVTGWNEWRNCCYKAPCNRDGSFNKVLHLGLGNPRDSHQLFWNFTSNMTLNFSLECYKNQTDLCKWCGQLSKLPAHPINIEFVIYLYRSFPIKISNMLGSFTLYNKSLALLLIRAINLSQWNNMHAMPLMAWHTLFKTCRLSFSLYLWQSCVEIEGYSVTYFNCITTFEVPYCWTSGWGLNALWDLLGTHTATNQWYSASNVVIRSKYATE